MPLNEGAFPRLLALCSRVAAVLGVLAGLVATPYAPRSATAATLPYIPLDHWTTPLIAEAAGRGLLPGLSLADRPFRRADVERALRDERAAVDSTQRSYTPFESWLLTRLESEFDPNQPTPAPAFARLTRTVGGALWSDPFCTRWLWGSCSRCWLRVPGPRRSSQPRDRRFSPSTFLLFMEHRRRFQLRPRPRRGQTWVAGNRARG